MNSFCYLLFDQCFCFFQLRSSLSVWEVILGVFSYAPRILFGKLLDYVKIKKAWRIFLLHFPTEICTQTYTDLIFRRYNRRVNINLLSVTELCDYRPILIKTTHLTKEHYYQYSPHPTLIPTPRKAPIVLPHEFFLSSYNSKRNII